MVLAELVEMGGVSTPGTLCDGLDGYEEVVEVMVVRSELFGGAWRRWNSYREI